MRMKFWSLIDTDEEDYSGVKCSYCKHTATYIVRLGFKSDLKPIIHNEDCYVNICESCLLKKAERYITREGQSMRVNKDGSWDRV